METDEYVLGTDPAELARLEQQHAVWRDAQLSLLQRGGLAAGDRVLDLGCGPGTTTFELAEVVGPAGRVIARDLSERFLVTLAREAARRAVTWVETSRGPVEALELAPASLDAVYARWLFSWLPEPRAALARVAELVRPGGVLLFQEYLDWAAFGVLPADADFDHVIDACMRSWHASGGTIDVARDLPGWAEELGLVVEHLAPLARIAAPGSPEWDWVGGFFEVYLPRLVEPGLLTRDELGAHLARWKAWGRSGSRRCTTPVLAEMVLRRPT